MSSSFPLRQRGNCHPTPSASPSLHWRVVGQAHIPQRPLSLTFAALADPTRRAILARLSSGEASATELAEPFHISAPAITKHLKVLERAGLISRSKQAQFRPCKLEPQALQQASDFLEQYRQCWEQSLDRLDAYLQELQTKGSAA